MKKYTLILIPARKGSVRLKKKNKKFFFGKPLITHSIIFAKKIKLNKKILITTDDPDILKIGKNHGILSPWLRPKNLSKGNSKSISFALHAINWMKKKYGKPKDIILLQPTSPFRSIKTLNKMLSIFKKNKQSVATATDNLKKNKKIVFTYKNKVIQKINKIKKRKLIKKVNIVGNIYLNSVENIKKYRDFVNKRTEIHYIKNLRELVDIDTPQDFKNAKKLI